MLAKPKRPYRSLEKEKENFCEIRTFHVTVVQKRLRNRTKNQHFQIPIRSGTHGHVSTSSYELLSAPWVNKLQITKKKGTKKRDAGAKLFFGQSKSTAFFAVRRRRCKNSL